MQQLQIHIPEPCHENWNNMLPDEQGRFCNSCAKTVIDFSAMTDGQMIDYFTKLKDPHVCGRVHSEQLQRTIQSQPAPRKKIFFYWKYLVALFLMTTKGQQSKAQVKAPQSVTHSGFSGTVSVMRPQPESSVKTSRILEKLKTFQITDENDEPVANATVKVSDGKYLVADSSGKVQLYRHQQSETLTITAVGFLPETINVKDISLGVVKLARDITNLETVVVTSDVEKRICSFTAGGLLYHVVKVNFVTDTLQKVAEFVNPSTSAYPNPVKKGSNVNLSVKLKGAGTYKVAIVNVSGTLMSAQTYRAADKKVTQQIPVPATWASGVYFMIITDEAGKKIGKEKIAVL